MTRTRSGRRSSERRGAALAVCLAGLAACSPAPVSPQPGSAAGSAPSAQPAAPVGQATSGWEAGKRGRFHSKRFSLVVPFPDGKTWKIDDRRGEWLVATHAPTSSVLRVRILGDDQPFNRKRCEERARAEDPSLPREHQGQLIEASDARVMPGWDAHSFSIVEPGRAGAPAVAGGARGARPPAASASAPPPAAPILDAHHVIFAAQVRRCLVVHFATRAAGPTAEATVGARLGEISELATLLRFEDETAGPGREPPDL
jgi:hypothetical protein